MEAFVILLVPLVAAAINLGARFGAQGARPSPQEGLKQAGGEAIGVVNLDTIPSPEALAEVEAHPDILSVSLIKLPPAGESASWMGA